MCRRAAERALQLAFLVLGTQACHPPSTTETPSPPSVVLFVLDAARADHFGCYGYSRDTTPHIDRLAQDGRVFDAAFSEAAYTYASAGALMTGRFPPSTGLVLPEPIDAALPLLAELASAAGFSTYAYSENPFVSSALGFGRGFDRFDEAFPYETYLADRENFPELRSGEGLREALAWMQSQADRPFFAYFHILRPHNPYDPPEAVRGRFGSRADGPFDGSTRSLLAMDSGQLEFTAAQLANVVALYDENLAYGDALFGQLYAGLEALGLLSRTVVIVTSDHGEAFSEHGRMLHNSTVFDEMLRIPLVVAHPGGATPGREAAPVQLTDLSHTLLEIFGGDPGAVGFEGRSLLATFQSGVAPSERPVLSWSVPASDRVALRTRAEKLIASASGPELLADAHRYDLERDPGEQRPLPATGDPNAERLLRGLQGILSQWTPADGADRQPLDPRVRSRLEVLGYVEEMLGEPPQSKREPLR